MITFSALTVSVLCSKCSITRSGVDKPYTPQQKEEQWGQTRLIGRHVYAVFKNAIQGYPNKAQNSPSGRYHVEQNLAMWSSSRASRVRDFVHQRFLSHAAGEWPLYNETFF